MIAFIVRLILPEQPIGLSLDASAGGLILAKRANGLGLGVEVTVVSQANVNTPSVVISLSIWVCLLVVTRM